MSSTLSPIFDRSNRDRIPAIRCRLANNIALFRLHRRPGTVILLLGLLAACAPQRAIEAINVLGDISAGHGASRLKAITPRPERRTIRSVPPERTLGDLYWPGERTKAALVLVPGAVADGRNDPRLIAFAHTFARAGFAVLVPEISGLNAQHLSAEHARPIGQAIQALADCAGSTKEPGSIGIAAISYAGGPTLLAALHPTTGALIHFALIIGGYFDTEAMITFATTGYFRNGPDTPWEYREPNAYGKWLFVQDNAPRLSDPADQTALAEIAARKLEHLSADIADLRGDLGHEGRVVMALLDNRDPDRASSLIDALPVAIRAELEALDLKRRDLSRLPFELLLVHGRDDPIIPSTESEALAAAVPDDRTSLYIVNSLAHVELGPAGLIDGMKLLRAVYRLLALRDALPAPVKAACLDSLQVEASASMR